MAVFKVFFQETLDTRIIREDTHTRYFEAESESQVRRALKEENYNIEFVQELSPKHLEYERENNADLNVESV